MPDRPLGSVEVANEVIRSEEHTSELQSQSNLVCRLLLVKQDNSSTGWAGRAADYIASQNINAPGFPAFVSLSGNSLLGTGAATQPVALTPGQSLQLKGFN